MKALVVLAVFCLVIGACTGSGDSPSSTSGTASTVGQSAEPGSTSTGSATVPTLENCHPTNDREDCTLVIVTFDEPVDLATAEAFAEEHNAYLNLLYRVDPVCVAKDFPIMGGFDLGETPSRRTYWEAEARMDRIAHDIGADLVPPPTIGGFDVIINQRMSDEWRLARQPGVLFDSVGLWIDGAGATALASEYTVDFPDHWRYEHAEGRGEIALDRGYDPPSRGVAVDPGCIGSDG